MSERGRLLARVTRLWGRWELAALKTLLSRLPEHQLLEEPELGYRLVTVLVNLRELGPAEQLGHRLRAHVEHTGNERIFRRVVNVDGVRLLLGGRLSEAEHEFLAALDMASRARDFSEVSATNTNIGIIASIRLAWDGAIVANTRAMVAAQRLGNANMVAGAYQNLGLTYREMSLYRSSEAAFEQAMEMYRSLNSQRVISVAAERALLQHATGDSPLAEVTARQALTAARANQLVNSEAECLRVVGIVVSGRAPEEAREYFSRSVPLAQQMQNRLLEAEILEAWAVLELRRDRPEEAADLAARSKEIYRSMGAERRAERVDERMA